MADGWWWWLVLLAAVIGGALWGVSRARRARDQGVFAGARLDPLRVDSRVPREYSPKNVGNDASARPWEVSAASGAEALAAAAVMAAPDPWPAGFDADAFLQVSKAHFVNLQKAWDNADVASLRAVLTDPMLQQIQSKLDERERASPGAASRTDVLMLDAQLLGVEEQDDAYVASVEFSGMSREQSAAGPNPFREVWAITRPKASEAAWLVAGVQPMQ